MLNPGTVVRNYLTQDELLMIAMVDGPKVTSWKQFLKDLKDLNVCENYELGEVIFSDPSPAIMGAISDFVEGDSTIVSAKTRRFLVEQYEQAMPVKHPLITVWFLLDMWCLDSRQFNMLSQVEAGLIDNYAVMQKAMKQGTPLYKPQKMSWRKFWALCATEMTASRKFFTKQ